MRYTCPQSGQANRFIIDSQIINPMIAPQAEGSDSLIGSTFWG